MPKKIIFKMENEKVRDIATNSGRHCEEYDAVKFLLSLFNQINYSLVF